MRAREDALAPGAEEIAVAVEHDHRVLAAVEDVDVVVAVDADAADFLERPAGRQLRPVLDRFVCVVAAAHGDHARAPLFIAGRQACHEAKESVNTCSGYSGNDSCGLIHFADTVVAKFSDKQIAALINGSLEIITQTCLRGQSSVTGISQNAISRNSRNNPCSGINLSDNIIGRITDVNIAKLISAHTCGRHRGIQGRAAIPGISGCAISANSIYDPVIEFVM